MRDVIPFDTNQVLTSYETDRWLVLTESDTVFRWGYADSDTTDGNTVIQASYQSRYFFEGPYREMVTTLDLFGTGQPDTLRLIFLYNSGEAADTVYFKPDFTDEKRDRVGIHRLCENVAVRIEDYLGVGRYRLTGYDLRYIPWDEGQN